METFKLREKPLVEISISDSSFIIVNDADSEKSREFRFSETTSLQLDKRTNWLVSISSFIVALFTSTGGEFYMERDVLKFNYKKNPISISLKGSDLSLSLEVMDKINQRIQHI